MENGIIEEDVVIHGWDVTIIDTETIDDGKSPYTVYRMQVTCNGTKWIILKRYKHFVKLQAQLASQYPGEVSLLSLPPRRMSGNLKPEFVEYRKNKLEDYLKQICSVPLLANSPGFMEFMEKPLEVESRPVESEDEEPGTVRIKKKDVRRTSSEDVFNYWVKGMNLLVVADFKAQSSAELSVSKGDVVVFSGNKDDLERGEVSTVDGRMGWVPLANFCVAPQFLSSSSLRNTTTRTPPAGRPNRPTIIQRISPDSPKIGNYRVNQKENLYYSKETVAKVNAAKHFMNDYYKRLYTYLNNRKARWDSLNEKLAILGNNPKEAQLLIDKHRAQETSILRRRRRKLTPDDFETLDMIGKGGFGKVYLSKEKATGDIMALKKIKKSVILQRNKVESVRTEREVLKGTESPWLVRLIYSFQDDKYLYFCMEYAPGGNLKGLLENVMLPEPEAKHYIAEMILAVHFLHELGFVHRDLKPDNFLFDKCGHIKLADFGLSKGGILKKTDIQLTPIRVYMEDDTFKTLALKTEETTEDIIEMMVKKLNLKDKTGCSLVIVDNNQERKMKSYEKPKNALFGWSTIHASSDTKPDKRIVFKVDSRYTRTRSLSVNEPRRKMSIDMRKLKREQAQKWTRSGKAYSFVGSPHYMAPEILTRQGYDERVDWWSIGCILYELIVGFPPFLGETPQEVFGNILDHEDMLQFPNDEDEIKMTGLAQDFVRRLLSPADVRLGTRGGYSEIKQHELLKDISWKELRNRTPPFVPQLESEIDTSYFHLGGETKDSGSGSNGSNETNKESPPHTSKLVSPSVPVKKNPGHKRNKSFDFVGFTYKPDSWFVLPELKDQEERKRASDR